MNVQQADDWNGKLCILEVAGRLFGADARERIWAEFGGRSIYVPLDPRQDHPICRAVGWAGARRIAEELGGAIVEVPVGPAFGWRHRRAAVLAASLAGDTVPVIAKRVGLTVRRVRQLRAAFRDAGKLPAYEPGRIDGPTHKDL